MQGGDPGLHTDIGLVRINSDGQIIQRHLDDIIPDLLGIVPVVCQGLVIGDQNINLIKGAGILQLDPPLQRSHIVTQVKLPGRPVPGQDDFLLTVFR